MPYTCNSICCGIPEPSVGAAVAGCSSISHLARVWNCFQLLSLHAAISSVRLGPRFAICKRHFGRTLHHCYILTAPRPPSSPRLTVLLHTLKALLHKSPTLTALLLPPLHSSYPIQQYYGWIHTNRSYSHMSTYVWMYGSLCIRESAGMIWRMRKLECWGN